MLWDDLNRKDVWGENKITRGLKRKKQTHKKKVKNTDRWKRIDKEKVVDME
jgi:hypothetical protein